MKTGLEPAVTLTVTIGGDTHLGPTGFSLGKFKALNQPKRTK